MTKSIAVMAQEQNRIVIDEIQAKML